LARVLAVRFGAAFAVPLADTRVDLDEALDEDPLAEVFAVFFSRAFVVDDFAFVFEPTFFVLRTVLELFFLFAAAMCTSRGAWTIARDARK